jgi:DNA invertase Pin-like site-specific DNA recombinase
MAVYGYIRVSTTEQALGGSLADQERRIRGVALMRGQAVDRIFAEPGISGSVPLEQRPMGSELAAALRLGDILVLAKLDRAFRNAADALNRADAWREAGVDLIVADMGTDPVTRDGAAKMFFGMLALVAEFERGRILERTAEGRRAKAQKGGHTGGSAPFGYRIEGRGREARLIPDPKQQKALAAIRRLRGSMSLRGIAKEVSTKHGVEISHEAVRRVLTLR